MTYYVSFDIGGTFVKYGLVDEAGKISEAEQFATAFAKATLLAKMQQIVTAFASRYPVAGVGISVPGFVETSGVLKSAGVLKELVGLNLKEEFSDLVHLPVAVENDANAAVLSEQWLGAGKNQADVILVTIGTGVGGGIIINNQLLAGSHFRAGEFGFMLTSKPYLGDTKAPSLSKVGALPSLYRNYYVQANTTLEDGKKIFALAAAGDVFAEKAIAAFASEISFSLYNLMMIFDTPSIIVGGAISQNKSFISLLNQQVAELFKGHDEIASMTPPAIIPAQFFNQAGLIGAVAKFETGEQHELS